MPLRTLLSSWLGESEASQATVEAQWGSLIASNTNLFYSTSPCSQMLYTTYGTTGNSSWEPFDGENNAKEALQLFQYILYVPVCVWVLVKLLVWIAITGYVLCRPATDSDDETGSDAMSHRPHSQESSPQKLERLCQLIEAWYLLAIGIASFVSFFCWDNGRVARFAFQHSNHVLLTHMLSGLLVIGLGLSVLYSVVAARQSHQLGDLSMSHTFRLNMVLLAWFSYIRASATELAPSDGMNEFVVCQYTSAVFFFVSGFYTWGTDAFLDWRVQMSWYPNPVTGKLGSYQELWDLFQGEATRSMSKVLQCSLLLVAAALQLVPATTAINAYRFTMGSTLDDIGLFWLVFAVAVFQIVLPPIAILIVGCRNPGLLRKVCCVYGLWEDDEDFIPETRLPLLSKPPRSTRTDGTGNSRTQDGAAQVEKKVNQQSRVATPTSGSLEAGEKAEQPSAPFVVKQAMRRAADWKAPPAAVDAIQRYRNSTVSQVKAVPGKRGY
jgi:hypothetical protein